jgi:hypothetical protein
MPDDLKSRLQGTRERGANLEIGGKKATRKVATDKNGKEYGSAGRYTSMNDAGEITDDVDFRNKLRAIRGNGATKVASLFGDSSGLGSADIADSNNIGYYSYEFPVDSLEMPADRKQELRFYRMAYDRDPIVGRAIDMHTELPLSKMVLEKPKCSSEEYADYIFDYFQGIVNRTKMFQVLIDAAREYWVIGEAFLFLEELEDVEPCPEAKKEMDKGKNKGRGADPGKESENAPLGGTATQILDFMSPSKQASWKKKHAAAIKEIKEYGIEFELTESAEAVNAQIQKGHAFLTKKASPLRSKFARMITAAPGDAPAGGAPAPDAGVPASDAGAAPPMPDGGEGAPLGDAGLGGVEGVDGGMDDMGGGMGMPMGGGGGGGFGGGATIPGDMSGDVKNAIALGSSMSAQRELMELRHYLHLLERKKELLEELQELRKKKKEETEMFAHVVNPDYEGFSRIKVLPPEQMDIEAEGGLGDDPIIYYKPPAKQKDAYLNSEDVPAEVKDAIETDGKVALNLDPFKGSYAIHFARKRANYELHGRSILQRCMRTIIYREKLRQVQTTLASRNMTPKSLIIAPDIPLSELMALRAHIDEAKSDPDYSVVLNYEARWDEIGSEGRLLSLDGEWSHTNSDLAIGLALSPELLIGEGMFSGSRIQMQLMETSYLQFRDILTGIIEDQIFLPIAQKRGFYEYDKYGKARWIFPKVSFSRMALRDSGDVYEMLFNLFSLGVVPVDIILDFLNLDPEDCKRKIQDNLFSVSDCNFNEVKSTIYNSVGTEILAKSDVTKRIIKGLTLQESDNEAESGPEGTGEGMA